MKKYQIDIVKEQLALHGEISRNWCLRNYISRLSSIIQKLEEQGYTFNPHSRDGDYVYSLTTRPTRTVRMTEVIDGKAIERLVEVPV